MHISAVDARVKLGELLSRVFLNNGEIIIERSGKSVAKLVRPDYEASPSPDQGKLLFSSARGLGEEVWKNVNVDEYIAAERGAWK